MASYKDEQGVWILYDEGPELGIRVIAIFEDVVPAARQQAREGRWKVGFWPFDMGLRDAVIQWEKRDQRGNDVLGEIEKIKWTVLEVVNLYNLHPETITDRADLASRVAIHVYEKHFKENK